MRFQRRQRLRRQGDFIQVKEQGKTFRCPHFFLQLLETDSPKPHRRRIGIITSRRVGNAVKRNRARRQFREIFRKNQEALPGKCDMVIVVRSSFDQAHFVELQNLFLKGVLHLCKTKPNQEDCP